MYVFKTKQIVCMLGCLLLSFVSLAQISENANNIYIEWQTSNCGINEDDRLVQLLLQNASVLEPLLLDGFRNGPSAEFIERTTVSELSRIRLNQKLISDSTLVTGLSKEDLQIAANADLDAARGNIQKSIIEGWKTRAITGLFHLKTDASFKLLKALAEDKDSPYYTLAKSLLGQD